MRLLLLCALALATAPLTLAQVPEGTQSLTVSGGLGLRPTRAAVGARYGYFLTPRLEAGPSVGVGYQRYRGEDVGTVSGGVGGRYWLGTPGLGFAPFVGAAADAVFLTGDANDYAVFEGNVGARAHLGRGVAFTPTAFVQVTEFGDVGTGVRLGACAFF